MGRIKMFEGASPLIFRNAGRLREDMTTAELFLWNHLRGNQLGIRFRSQHPINLYIADFYCHRSKLVIEIVGGIHQLPEIKAIDQERQLFLE